MTNLQKQSEKTGDDFRLNVKDPTTMVYWQGQGTYYFIPRLCIWCRIRCIDVLDDLTEKGAELIFMTERDVKEI